MLGQLKEIHDQVRGVVAELAGILAETKPDLQALARTRMKLTKLTGKWRTLIQCTILPELSHVGPDQARQLAELRREAAAFAVKKSNHITRWSSRATEADVAGYRRASADMRRSLLSRVDLEAGILYPLLGTKATTRAQPAEVSPPA